MKLKKYISRLLFYSILLNNISLYSNAVSNSNLNRYQTLEGEFIDLDDTKSEDITEIEIFGNTIQDPYNLEDIQSVGDLYVNQDGEPILDSQGREQYKVEIEIINKNLAKERYDENPLYAGMGLTHISEIDNPIVGNTYYTTMFNIDIDSNHVYIEYDNDTKLKTSWVSFNKYNKYKNSYTVTNDKCNKLVIIHDYSYANNNKLDCLFNVKEVVSLNNHVDTYEENKTNKITILLPCQLIKVGDISDKLYWDNKKGKYAIEKNIYKYNLSELDLKQSTVNDSETFCFTANIGDLPLIPNDMIGICNGGLCQYYHQIYWGNGTPSAFGKNAFGAVGSEFIGRIRKDEGVKDINTAKEWLEKNNIYCLYKLKTPQVIETNITEPIKPPTYTDKTYISTVSENGIKPTLKIYIDRIEQVSQEAVDLATSAPTSSNLTLARMYVNMLPESLYKDQLQAKLNEIFSEDMVLDRLAATANLDVYIKSENILMMSLNTNTVTFEDYSGVEELEIQDAIGISINSSLPYQLNAYIVGDITNKDKDKTLDLDVLNIKDGSELVYKQFDSINTKLVLLDNVEKGNNISHNIDLKLSGNKAHDADVYKTTIKFEVEQK